MESVLLLVRFAIAPGDTGTQGHKGHKVVDLVNNMAMHVEEVQYPARLLPVSQLRNTNWRQRAPLALYFVTWTRVCCTALHCTVGPATYLLRHIYC